MPKPREELRRGLRALIERTSHEMEALGDPSAVDAETEERAGAAASKDAAPDTVVLERSSEAEGSGGGAAAGTADRGDVSSAKTAQATSASAVSPAPSGAHDPTSRPMLRLVRNTVRTLIGTREAPAGADTEAAAAKTSTAAVSPAVAPAVVPAVPSPDADVDVHFVHPRRGVCESYYINQACWEVPDAFCNNALHTCMLRDCPVYNLHREDLEKRFATRYSHLW